MTRPPRVFISYAGVDWNRFVRGFGEALRAKGIDAWVAYWEIGPGDSLVRKIFDEGLTRADAVVVVLSYWSVDKPWVKEELDLAKIRQIEERVRLIPVRIDDCEVPAALRATKRESIKDLDSYEPQLNEIVAALLGQHERPALGQLPAYVQPAAYAFSGLTQIDNHVLALVCERALANDGYRIEISELREMSRRLELDAGQLDESLHVLHEEGYVRFFRVSEGIKYVHLDPPALDEYSAATQPHYEAATKAVLAHIANHSDETIVTVPRPEGVASIVFQGILKRWERHRMFTVMKSFGPQVRVTKISPKIKRLITGI